MRPGYCPLSDVTARLYSEEDPSMIPVNTGRDALLTDLIQVLSREFDDLTGRPPGNFAPVFEARLFSGIGAQVLDIEEAASIFKVEVNLNPPAPVWTDVTAEMAQGQLIARPIRYWPKTELFRMQSFYVDPYRNGNVRVTGVWGSVQPDAGAPVPAAPWNGLSEANIAAVQPKDAMGNPAGWWIVPEEVRNCIASWSVYNLKAAQAAFADNAGGGSAPSAVFNRGVPAFVPRVADTYTRGRPKIAMIGLDGTDFIEEATYRGPQETVSRWAGWQTYP
jgi:hypothetical protein